MSVPVRTDERGVRRYDVPLPRDLVAMLDETVAAHPTKTAYVTDSGALTWTEFGDEVRSLAGRLAGHGVVPGDRVAILAGNGMPYTVAVNAIWRAGGIAVPLNFRLTGTDLAGLLEDSGSRLLLVGPGMYELADEASRRMSSKLDVQRADDDGRFLAHGAILDVTATTPGANAPAAIMYTSGTTGRPKGVVISHDNAMQNSVTCTTVIGRRPDDVELGRVP